MGKKLSVKIAGNNCHATSRCSICGSEYEPDSAFAALQIGAKTWGEICLDCLAAIRRTFAPQCRQSALFTGGIYEQPTETPRHTRSSDGDARTPGGVLFLLSAN